MKNSDSNRSYNSYEQPVVSPIPFGGGSSRPGGGVFGLFITAAIILVVALVIFLIGNVGKNADKSQLENWKIGKDYYYEEYKGNYWGEFASLETPVRLGETKTHEDALENSIWALKYFFGNDTDITDYIPITLTYFPEDDIWLVITNHEPDELDGGVGFTIDAEIGDLSDYEIGG